MHFRTCRSHLPKKCRCCTSLVLTNALQKKDYFFSAMAVYIYIALSLYYFCTSLIICMFVCIDSLAYF